VPVTAWQGIRNNGTNAGEYLICGTSDQTNGLLYIGSINGGGSSYLVEYADTDTNVVTTTTSVYGPDHLTNGGLRLVGSYRKSSDTNIFNHGFVWEGTTNDLPSGGTYRSIDYPGATYQFVHSTMGGLAVGNADGPKRIGTKTLPIGPGVAYIYNVLTNGFVTTIPYPGAKSVTAYGIWYNGATSYTICGGYSPALTNNLTNQEIPLTQGKGYLVDYDSFTGKFSHWKSFNYPNGPAKVNFITHFEGISSTETGIYTLAADSVQAGTTNPAQGSWVSVRRNADGSFDNGRWVDLNADDSDNDGDIISSANSVYGNQVVGIVAGVADSSNPLAGCSCGTITNATLPFAYQASVNIAFERSNVIGGSKGNGISLNASKGNVIAMNFIGTDSSGSTNTGFGNGGSGILLTNGSSGNVIGGQEGGSNNPTGVPPVFDAPAQGNLISGNGLDGILITGSSGNNLVSGNFIGTDASGTNTLGNGLDGVGIENSRNNSLLGSSPKQNPLAFYNVIGGNGRDGVHLLKANNTVLQENQIEANTVHGIFASGPCAKSVIKGNEISNNGTNAPTDNVDVSGASGVIYTP
jgi:trimeric autotransporter adhesin